MDEASPLRTQAPVEVTTARWLARVTTGSPP
jgi:hypothetical protein